jgi:hypothetical protein
MARKPWTKMTTEELTEATKEFDHGPGPKAIRPTAAELAKHRKAGFSAAGNHGGRGRGRPKLGSGAARVLFTIDPGLLVRLDAFARKRGLKRSQLIAQSVEAYIGNRGAFAAA